VIRCRKTTTLDLSAWVTLSLNCLYIFVDHRKHICFAEDCDALRLLLLLLFTSHSCAFQARRASVQGTTRPAAVLPGGGLPTCCCHRTSPTAFVAHRHTSSSANQHTVRRSLVNLPLPGHEHGTVCQSNCETLNYHSDNSGGH